MGQELLIARQELIGLLCRYRRQLICADSGSRCFREAVIGHGLPVRFGLPVGFAAQQFGFIAALCSFTQLGLCALQAPEVLQGMGERALFESLTSLVQRARERAQQQHEPGHAQHCLFGARQMSEGLVQACSKQWLRQCPYALWQLACCGPLGLVEQSKAPLKDLPATERFTYELMYHLLQQPLRDEFFTVAVLRPLRLFIPEPIGQGSDGLPLSNVLQPLRQLGGLLSLRLQLDGTASSPPGKIFPLTHAAPSRAEARCLSAQN
ncbi:hypothetical protein AQI88_16530 [Streptomyces cellostaticus]|uniref:Uncharacterized protein n=1 Tax=Streptomyces cellostaticus TaxID=67285 RepID=A0A101NLV1_9ACTN|nr:hypothetical protein AQI88_16530 [Streptomyces cellostaticus]